MATKLKPKTVTTKEVDDCGISIKIIKENRDGSADAKVTFNKQGLETLVQWGMVSILAAAIDAYKPVPDKDIKIITRGAKK
jgi:hypothetical protein